MALLAGAGPRLVLLDAHERLAVGDVLAPLHRGRLVAMGWLLGLFGWWRSRCGGCTVATLGDVAHRLLEKIRVLLTATDAAQLTPRGTGRNAGAGAPSTSWRASATSCAATWREQVARPAARRAGAQPPGRADGRAHAERGGVQPRRPHPALQQPRALQFRALSDRRRRWPAGPS
jgi:hypothetical protein